MTPETPAQGAQTPPDGKSDDKDDKRRAHHAPSPKRTVAPHDWGRYPYGIEFKDLKKRRPLMLVSLAAMTHLASLAAVAGVGAAFASGHPMLGLGVAAAASLPLGVLNRGLESLVHGASHYDIADDHAWNDRIANTLKAWPAFRDADLDSHLRVEWNDCLADALMAWPVFQRTGPFRRMHLDRHHGDFAGQGDPCRARMEQHADVMDGKLPSLAKTLLGLPREIMEFYKTTGANPLTALLGLGWHMAVLVLPTALLTGNPLAALAAWAAVSSPTFFLTLPTVRALAEAGEHDYASLGDLSKSMVERTFDKTGFLNSIIHLYGDQWHIGHHAFPGVPQCNLGKLTKRLIAAGRGIMMKRRKSILGKPEAYGAAKETGPDGQAPSNDN